MSELFYRDQAHLFLERAFADLDRNQFALDPHWHIDHLCYRTSTQENYLAVKGQFHQFSRLLIESEVNGRLISTFKLQTPIVFNEWEIDLIEVPAPKAGKTTQEGFEHFEVVCDLPFDQIKKRYSQCQFDESGLIKDFNQELEIPFGSFALKFHHLSLESVINVEANGPVFSALQKTDILKILRPFSPLLAGSFPLNVNLSNSDLDILICIDDLRVAEEFLSEKLGHFQNFRCEEILVKNRPTLLVSFSFQGLNFEIFGQNQPTVMQEAYLHFLIEERLLKIGDEAFFQKIIEARARGLKVEAAFAKTLELRGDPFDETLALQKQSNVNLKDFVNQVRTCASKF